MTKLCVICGKPFSAGQNGEFDRSSNAKTCKICGPKRARAMHYIQSIKRMLKLRKAAPQKRCLMCGVYLPKGKRLRKTCMGKTCRRKYGKLWERVRRTGTEKGPGLKACALCNRTFEDRNGSGKTCQSPHCKREWAAINRHREYHANREMHIAASTKWYYDNRDRRLIANRQKVATLADSYIVSNLHFPPELIALKREQLKLMRLIRQKQNEKQRYGVNVCA